MKGAKGGARDNQITFHLKRKNLKKKKEKKEQQHVYRVRDFFVLPLILGMAFYQGKDFQQKKDGTLSLEPEKKDPIVPTPTEPKENVVIEVIEQQLEEILDNLEEAVDPSKKPEEERIDLLASTLQLLSFVEEEIEEIKVVDQIGDLIEATKEDQPEEEEKLPSSIEPFTEEEQDQIQEANTWIEENHVLETLEEAKKVSREISLSFKDQEMFQRRKQELKDITALIREELLRQVSTMREIEEKVNSITNQVQQRLELASRNRERIVSNLFLLQAISNIKMNRFMKFFMRLSLLSSLVRTSYPKHEQPDLSPYLESLSKMETTNHSMLSDLERTMQSTNRFIREFEREYGPYREEIPEYDSMLKEIQKAEDELEQQALKIKEQNRSIQEKSHKILEKKY